MKKITETVICLKDGGLTLADTKRIRTTLGKTIYNTYLRAEKLHEQCYILRFKKATTREEADTLIKYLIESTRKEMEKDFNQEKLSDMILKELKK